MHDWHRDESDDKVQVLILAEVEPPTSSSLILIINILMHKVKQQTECCRNRYDRVIVIKEE